MSDPHEITKAIKILIQNSGGDFSNVDLNEVEYQTEGLGALFNTRPVAPFRETPRKGPGGGSGQSDSS